MAAANDTFPDGTPIRKGEFVSYSSYSMGRLEYLWGSDVAEFKPERWLRNGVYQPESPFKLTAFQVKCTGRPLLSLFPQRSPELCDCCLLSFLLQILW